MIRVSPRAWLLAAIGALLAAGIVLPQTPLTPPGKDGKPPVAKEEPTKAPSKINLDNLKVPPGSLIVICEEIKEGLRLMPKGVLLSPEKYQELLDRIALLEKQLKPTRKPPGVCKLTGQLDGDFVRFQAEFKLTTEQPREWVTIGCKGASLTEARLDPGTGDPEGTLPMLEPAADGYNLRVEKPGEHLLTAKLKVPVGVKSIVGGGSETGFELGLPGAAVTTLEVELPPAVKEIRCNERRLRRGNSVKGGKWEVALGAVQTLSVGWKQPLDLPGTGPLVTVEGDIVVTLEEKYVRTEATLTLQDLRGQVKEFVLAVPKQATVKPRSGEERIARIHQPDTNRPVFHIILKEPSLEAVQVVVKQQQSRPFTRLPIGPYTVQGASDQHGTIVVQVPPETGRNLWLVYLQHGEGNQLETTAEQRAKNAVAAFRYRNLPALNKGDPVLPPPPLELEAKTVRGSVETRVDHDITLRAAEEGKPGWQVETKTKIEVTPLHAEVDSLEVQLPRSRSDDLGLLAMLPGSGWEYQFRWAAALLGEHPQARSLRWVPPAATVPLGDGPAASAELLPADGLGRARIKLREPSKKTFTVELRGTYYLPRPDHPEEVQRVSLALPRPMGSLERSAKVQLHVIADNIELLVREAGREVPAANHKDHTITLDRAPSFTELSWRPYRPELSLNLVADVVLHEYHATVTQRLQYQSPQKVPTKLSLDLPKSIESVRVISGGTEQLREDRTLWITPVPGPKLKEPLVVTFDFALPPPARQADAAARQFKVPLLWPIQATRVDTKIRIWTPPGSVAALAEPAIAEATWRDEGTEVVPERRDSLPSLVLRGLGFSLPPASPTIRLLDSAPAVLARAVIDRALIQVSVDEKGQQTYRARFLVSRWNTQSLEVELPPGVVSTSLEVRLHGAAIPWRQVEGGRVIQVKIKPELYARPVIFEIRYQLSSGRPESTGWGNRSWQTRLAPPLPRGEVLLERVRWQVDLPPGWVYLDVAANASVEQRFGRRGWLLGPTAALTTADLEQWLLGDGNSEQTPAQKQEEAEEPETASLVLTATELEPLRLIHVPQQVWLLVCSLLLLLVVLGLSLAPLSRTVFWTVVIVLLLGILVIGFLWPGLLSSIAYGCEPGFAVLLLVLVVQWGLHRRYKRQLVFMPGFTRLKTGSSLTRRTGSSNRPLEPSTIDAPTTGSSASEPSG
jgi:hypothetical protein